MRESEKHNLEIIAGIVVNAYTYSVKVLSICGV
jgi:hypothetical protein